MDNFKLIAFLLVVISVMDLSIARHHKNDIIIIGGQNGCGPQLVLKTGGRRGKRSTKGDIILIGGDCHKEKKHKEVQYIPFPVHSYGHGMHGMHGMQGWRKK
jgi:ABC-type cobalamin/Fe3+-siderophores transport system ATPase subunit